MHWNYCSLALIHRYSSSSNFIPNWIQLYKTVHEEYNQQQSDHICSGVILGEDMGLSGWQQKLYNVMSSQLYINYADFVH